MIHPWKVTRGWVICYCCDHTLSYWETRTDQNYWPVVTMYSDAVKNGTQGCYYGVTSMSISLSYETLPTSSKIRLKGEKDIFGHNKFTMSIAQAVLASRATVEHGYSAKRSTSTCVNSICPQCRGAIFSCPPETHVQAQNLECCNWGWRLWLRPLKCVLPAFNQRVT